MSSFGIGLGGFMDGFSKGYGIRSEIDDRKERKSRLVKQDARQEKMDARSDLENQRADLEYDRALTQRNEIDQIGTTAKQQFDTAVTAGQAQPDEFDSFFSKYALPKLKNTYLLQGDVDKAQKVSEWGETAGAKAGAKLFGASLSKSMSGDYEGSIADANKALQQPGYFGDGYSLKIVDSLVDTTGKKLGYRIQLDRPDGDPIESDVRLDNFPTLISTLGNPDEAFKHQQLILGAAAKTNADLEKRRLEKMQDRELGIGGGATRQKAIETLRKRSEDDLGGETPAFDALPRQQQEAAIAAEIELMNGAPGLGGQPASTTPQRRVIVDQNTGQRVETAQRPAPQPVEQQVPGTAPEQTAEQPSILERLAGGVKREVNSLRGRGEGTELLFTGGDRSPGRRIAESGPEREPENKNAVMVNNAMKWIASGADPKQVAQQLLDEGVPQEQWPPELRQALMNGAGVVGLGR